MRHPHDRPRRDGETLRLASDSTPGISMQRRASAQWRGGLKDGKGTVSTASGAVKNVAYSFAMRFGDEPGTNPEELVAAAHAACFSMASRTSSVRPDTARSPSRRRRRWTSTRRLQGGP